MRQSHRLSSLAIGTAAAALLAACAAPSQPVSRYPSAPVTTSSSSNFPSASAGVATSPASIEMGRVTDIQTVEMGATSATNPTAGRAIVGGIIGAVVGNVVGKNVNSGDNRTAATVLGGAAGAAIGARSGQNQASTASSGAGGPAYRVNVQTDSGQMRTYEVGALGDLRVGDRVRIENNVIYRS